MEEFDTSYVAWHDHFDRWLFDGEQARRVDRLMKCYCQCYQDLSDKRKELVERLDVIPKPETREEARITQALHGQVRIALIELNELFDKLLSCKIGYHDGMYKENFLSHGIRLSDKDEDALNDL